MDPSESGLLHHAWQVMHPPVQPHDHGWLNVGDGHAIYWERCGHPGAPAAVFVHGGPGAGATVNDRRWFQPQHWHTVLFDQRGCGRSRADDDLRANTTAHLVHDLEALRLHLGIGRWLLVGGSWGSTLALAYAQAHPQHVLGLVLRGVFLGTLAERDGLYTAAGAARDHPQAWQRLCAGVGLLRGSSVLESTRARLQAGGDAAIAAARAWWRWEQDLMASEAGVAADVATTATDDDHALRAAGVAVQFACNGWFLPEGALLQWAHRLLGVPGVILQGGRDAVTPPAAAQALHAAWDGSQLRVVKQAGHASTHPAMAGALIQAIDGMVPVAAATTAGPKAPTDAHLSLP